MHKPSRVEVAGPLAGYAIGFRRELAGRGYSRSRTTGLLLLMARLSRWLTERGREAGDLCDADVEQFVSCRRLVSRDDRRLTARAMAPLLEYLRGLGVAPRPVPVGALTARDRLLDAFVGYLAAERGLAASTIGTTVTSLSGSWPPEATGQLGSPGWVPSRSARSCWLRRPGVVPGR